MDLCLKGKKAIVTGATKGIGLRIARLLADEGVDVGICSRSETNVKQAMADLEKRRVKIVGDAVDVRKGDKFVSWLKSAAERLGGVDIFVSNATGDSDGTSEEEWRRGFEVDILGAVRGTQTLLPHLRNAESGAIVLISSVAALISKSHPDLYAYASCKAALISYGAQLSKDLAQEGIRVNTVSPGAIYFDGGAWDRIESDMPELFEETVKNCPIGRLGKPEEIANAVVFLASPVSAYTVGQNIHIDGGYMQHADF